MESKYLSEEQFREVQRLEDDNLRVSYFKLVDVAPSARSKVNYSTESIANLVGNIPGYFLLSSNLKDLRETLHIFIDSMIDAIEESNE